MSDNQQRQPSRPTLSVEHVTALSEADLNDLCDATDAAIEGGGGFGWVKLPARDILERYWRGVMAMPQRMLFVARLDGVVCGTAQLVKPPVNNEAQSFAIQLTGVFIAPWARGHGLSRLLLGQVERTAQKEGFAVINLDVRETMEGAITLFESSGYTRIGTHPFYARVGDNILKGHYYYKVIDPRIAPRH